MSCMQDILSTERRLSTSMRLSILSVQEHFVHDVEDSTLKALDLRFVNHKSSYIMHVLIISRNASNTGILGQLLRC